MGICMKIHIQVFHLLPNWLLNNVFLASVISILLDLALIWFLPAFLGYPGQRRAKVAQLSKFGRPVSGLLRLVIYYSSLLIGLQSFPAYDPNIFSFIKIPSTLNNRNCQDITMFSFVLSNYVYKTDHNMIKVT